MNESKNAYNQLLYGIQKYVEKCVDESKRDITLNALVKNIKSDGYDIIINGVQYNNIQTLGGVCHVNEIVKVLIPQNNYNDMVILKSGSSGESGLVDSVNGKVGNVILTYNDVGALNVNDIETQNIDFSNYFNS